MPISKCTDLSVDRRQALPGLPGRQGDEGGAAAAQPPAQDGAPRRMSRRDSFGLPDSLDLGTLHIGPGSPPVISDR